MDGQSAFHIQVNPGAVVCYHPSQSSRFRCPSLSVVIAFDRSESALSSSLPRFPPFFNSINVFFCFFTQCKKRIYSINA